MSDKRPVYGIGVNDADYIVSKNENINGKRKTVWFCPIYIAWVDMLRRCYSEKYQERRPTYIGCSVHPDWHVFSVFRSWVIEQDWQGNSLDKDILVPGNRIYSSELCVYVSVSLNNFLIDCASARGLLPVGVYLDKNRNKYAADCRNPFTKKREHLGRFDDANEANEAWRRRKHEHACRYADQQTDKRIADALRSRFAPTGSAMALCEAHKEGNVSG